MKKYFLTGLVTLLPLAVTIWVVHLIIHLVTKPFTGIMKMIAGTLPIKSVGILTKDYIIAILSPLLVLILLVLFTWLLGLVARRFFFNQLIRFGDRMLHKIPLVNKVYKTSKDIVKSLFGETTHSFQQVVMIPFPYPGCYCIGLIAKKSPKTCSSAEGKELVSVFVPTAPNPTTGFLVMSNQAELIYLKMKNEEAIKYIVSCAVIVPDRPIP